MDEPEAGRCRAQVKLICVHVVQRPFCRATRRWWLPVVNSLTAPSPDQDTSVSNAPIVLVLEGDLFVLILMFINHRYEVASDLSRARHISAFGGRMGANSEQRIVWRDHLQSKHALHILRETEHFYRLVGTIG